MSSCTIIILEPDNQKDLIQYEQGVYRAWKKTGNQEYLDYYHVKGDRLVSKIPYKDKIIYLVKLDDTVVAGTAVHTNMDNMLQLEQVGFLINQTEPDICEGTGLWSELMAHDDIGMISMALLNFFQDDLRKRGYKKMYSTTNEKLLFMHKLHSKVIDECELNEKKQYLLVMEL